ncbi:hypothetical protein EG68_06522 [Paragonimus skrjabini miyazakii]|uniref:Rab-GAP TBC domain-containing protein n=1 Tax=Paragonimus skrjabini miyazakii TaxID=59628 RepID=A0A8S9YP93_9TREM|nr:hypothetical protein EG68_06522 [Paragonimus skrjabini miyazakii]
MLRVRDGLLSCFAEDSMDLKRLKVLCFDGCPEIPGIRSQCWKFLLNYLPIKKDRREDCLISCRKEYAAYVKEFVMESSSSESSDHPLSSTPDGDWINFFNDNEVLLQINKDCRRLCPDFDFFHRDTEYPCNKLFGDEVPVGVLRRRVETSFLQSQAVYHNLVGVTNMVQTSLGDSFHSCKALVSGLDNSSLSRSATYTINCSANRDEVNIRRIVDGEPHWEVIQRILFVYYKTHVAQRYVQGMNEVIAPIYYLFATDPSDQCRRHAEADSFFCFNNLMTEIYPNFVRKLDNDRFPGIGGQLRLLMNLLVRFDKVLSDRLQKIGLEVEHYAFRWLSLLLAREFYLPDVIRLWDTLFADEKRFAMLPFVCCAMLILIRDQLMVADFPTAVHLVQNYPPTVPLTTILSTAKSLYRKG